MRGTKSPKIKFPFGDFNKLAQFVRIEKKQKKERKMQKSINSYR